MSSHPVNRRRFLRAAGLTTAGLGSLSLAVSRIARLTRLSLGGRRRLSSGVPSNGPAMQPCKELVQQNQAKWKAALAKLAGVS